MLFERAAEQGEMDFSPKASSIDKERLEWLAKEYKDAIHKSRWGEKRFEHRVSEYSDGIVWMTPDGHKKVIGPDRLRQMERMGLDVKDVQRVIRVEHMRVWKELNDELQTFNNQEADDVPF